MKVLLLTLICFCAAAPTASAEVSLDSVRALKRIVLAAPAHFTASDAPEKYVRAAYENGWANQDILRPDLYAAGIQADVLKINVLWHQGRAEDEQIWREFDARFTVLDYIAGLPLTDAATWVRLVSEVPPLHRFDDFYIKPSYAHAKFTRIELLPCLRFMRNTQDAVERVFIRFLKLKPDGLQKESMRSALDLDPPRARWIEMRTRVTEACTRFLDRIGMEF